MSPLNRIHAVISSSWTVFVLGIITGIILPVWLFYAENGCLLNCSINANYEIEVQTSNASNSGTGSIVYLIIEDERGFAALFEFDGRRGDIALEEGAKDQFFSAQESISSVVYAKLSMVVRGEKSGWNPKYIQIKNRHTEETFCLTTTEALDKFEVLSTENGKLIVKPGKCSS